MYLFKYLLKLFNFILISFCILSIYKEINTIIYQVVNFKISFIILSLLYSSSLYKIGKFVTIFWRFVELKLL
jgi:hypothetical protein